MNLSRQHTQWISNTMLHNSFAGRDGRGSKRPVSCQIPTPATPAKSAVALSSTPPPLRSQHAWKEILQLRKVLVLSGCAPEMCCAVTHWHHLLHVSCLEDLSIALCQKLTTDLQTCWHLLTGLLGLSLEDYTKYKQQHQPQLEHAFWLASRN